MSWQPVDPEPRREGDMPPEDGQWCVTCRIHRAGPGLHCPGCKPVAP